MRTTWIAVLVAVGISLILASSSFAGHHHNSSNDSSNNAPPPPAASQPSVPSQFSVDQAAQTAAAAQLSKDQKDLQSVSDADWAKFQQTPAWTAAQAKVTSAQAALDAAKQAAVDNLANNPDYQAALAAKKKAVDDLTAAKASDDATPDTLAPLANASLQASINLRKITKQVQDSDTGVANATENLQTAQHDADMLKMKFQLALPSDPAYVAAKATVDAAQKQFDDAHAKLLADNNISSGN
jgi:hypothetical protein